MLRKLNDNVYLDDVYDKLERAGTFKKSDNCMVFLGIHDAVLSAVESNTILFHQVLSALSSCLIETFV